MTNLRVRPYEAKDFLDIELMEYEKKCREGQPVEVWAEMKESAGPAFTVVDPEGDIVFICGIHGMWPGVGEIWAVFSPLSARYMLTLRIAKCLLKSMFDKHYVRLQAALDADNCPQAIRFDERLGFTPEGVLRRYGPHGEDRVMYALVKECEDGE